MPEYALVVHFGAPDDEHARRKGEDIAELCAAEHGTSNPVIAPVDGDYMWLAREHDDRVKERDEAQAEVERLRARVETLLMDFASEGQRADEAEAERDAAHAAIARVRRMAQVWVDIRPTGSTATGDGHVMAYAGQQILADLDASSAPETPCPRCEGSMIEPGSEDYDPAVHMHNPTTGEPCTACNGTGKATGWLDQLAAMSLRAAKAKFGPDGSELCRCGNPDDCSCTPESPQEDV